eukprot:COSAG03_NODE_173_length_11167_cov_181.916697_7_plen_39_part_00
MGMGLVFRPCTRGCCSAGVDATTSAYRTVAMVTTTVAR